MWSHTTLKMAEDVVLAGQKRSSLYWQMWGDDQFDLNLLDLDSSPNYPNIIKEKSSEFNEIILSKIEECYKEAADKLIEQVEESFEDDSLFDNIFTEYRGDEE